MLLNVKRACLAAATRTRSAANVRTLARLVVRAEDDRRTWERRTPLTPTDVSQLVKQHSQDGLRVLVENSDKRCFGAKAYREAGAQLINTLESQPTDSEDGDVVLGIKEIPISALEAQSTTSSPKTYAFFSHTHKGQPYNLKLLQTMLESKASRFIDWELLTDDNGQRTAAFGWHAGFAGMVDGLTGLGTKLLARLGVATPLLELKRPHQVGMGGVDEITSSLEECGKRWMEEMKEDGSGERIGPIVFGINGTGRVGNGAKAVLDHLGVTWIKKQELESLVKEGEADTSKLYACQLTLKDWIRPRDTSKTFDREEYRRHPERFESVFASEVAPFLTMVLNGGFWETGCPRLLTTKELAILQQTVPANRFLSVVDIGCDWNGSLEFVTRATTVNDPFLQIDAATGEMSRDPASPRTTQVSAVEIYPSTLAVDSSKHFSSCIMPYVDSLVKDPTCSNNQDPLARALRRAIVVENGQLAEKHHWLQTLLSEADKPKRKVVLLGSGLVAGPAVRTLAARSDLDVVIASNDMQAAEKLAAGHDNVRPAPLDANDQTALENLIEGADVVLSLLPAPMHPGVAKLCIRHGASLVTASYVSEDMKALHSEAERAGVVLLNELGLDPGIDHASAMQLIKEAQSAGNTIESFVSFCGGLPAPEISNGPLGYKFSWSPRGVLSAALNDATFRLNSRQVSFPGTRLLKSHFSSVPILRGFSFEGVANRNSLGYLEEYGLPSNLPTILRGTLRYPGFARTVDIFKRIGLLDQEALSRPLERWDELFDLCLARKGCNIESEHDRVAAITRLAGLQPGSEATVEALSTLVQLGLCPGSRDESLSLPTVPKSAAAPLDLLSTLLGTSLAYKAGERDAVILHHELSTKTKNNQIELFTSTLVQYGDNEASAMATTVGIPIALGALLFLDGHITSRGLVSPSSPQVWRPLLEQLGEHGITLVERRKTIQGPGQSLVDVLKEQVKEIE
ncbi:hypothetical protein OIV83_004779 [Microbotryomycetes sp. JL201]|nr:hypothetical protein OIV83_004779 [Microbotryomycetes sp. JL201]